MRKVKERLPWTDNPSMDGKSYLTNGSYIIRDALLDPNVPGHFRWITVNEQLTDRDHTSSNTEFFFLNGEKGGPMATYLVTASQRKNFKLQMNTMVSRVLRNGDVAIGVEVESTASGGLSGTIKVTPGSGRVILSAGVFGTFKVLLRSGIGPLDELQRLANGSTEASKLPPKQKWIDLPVGYNLDDGPNFYIGLSVQDLEYYDWEAKWNSTKDDVDVKRYLESRSGPLAQLQASIGPVSWDTVLGADGKKRVIQWDFSSGRNALLPGDGKLTLCIHRMMHTTDEDIQEHIWALPAISISATPLVVASPSILPPSLSRSRKRLTSTTRAITTLPPYCRPQHRWLTSSTQPSYLRILGRSSFIRRLASRLNSTCRQHLGLAATIGSEQQKWETSVGRTGRWSMRGRGCVA